MNVWGVVQNSQLFIKFTCYNLVPEGQIVPGRRVLARSITNLHNYDAGYVLSSQETFLFVVCDTWGFPMFYDTNDIAAVVVDMKLFKYSFFLFLLSFQLHLMSLLKHPSSGN